MRDLLIKNGWIVDLHIDGEGKSVPSFYAELSELLALGRSLCKAGRGVMEITAKMVLPEGEQEAGDLPDLVALAKESGRPVTWASVRYLPAYPGRSLFILSQVAEVAQREGVRLHPQIGCRPFETLRAWPPTLSSSIKTVFVAATVRQDTICPPSNRV